MRPNINDLTPCVAFYYRPTLEDPFLFTTLRGFHVLMHYFKADNCTAGPDNGSGSGSGSGRGGKAACANVGNHAYAAKVPRLLPGNNGAADGSDVEFYLTPPRGKEAGGYNTTITFDNGTTGHFSHREEPKLLLEWSDALNDFAPTYLFNVVVEDQVAPSDGWAHLESYIWAQPLATSESSSTRNK